MHRQAKGAGYIHRTSRSLVTHFTISCLLCCRQAILLIALLGIPLEHHGPFLNLFSLHPILDSREVEKDSQIVSPHRLETFKFFRARWKAWPLQRSADASFKSELNRVPAKVPSCIEALSPQQHFGIPKACPGYCSQFFRGNHWPNLNLFLLRVQVSLDTAYNIGGCAIQFF